MSKYFEYVELCGLLNFTFLFKKCGYYKFKLHVMAHSMFLLDSTGLDYESYSGAWRENEFSIYYFYSH